MWAGARGGPRDGGPPRAPLAAVDHLRGAVRRDPLQRVRRGGRGDLTADAVRAAARPRGGGPGGTERDPLEPPHCGVPADRAGTQTGATDRGDEGVRAGVLGWTPRFQRRPWGACVPARASLNPRIPLPSERPISGSRLAPKTISSATSRNAMWIGLSKPSIDAIPVSRRRRPARVL